jgi:hypothetical protein
MTQEKKAVFILAQVLKAIKNLVSVVFGIGYFET